MADEQTIQQDIPEQQTAGGQPDPTQALYDNLHKAQLYTKSYDEFKQKYSTPQAIDDLYGKLNGLQLYTKGKQDFYQKYFPSSQEKPFVAPKVELMEPPKTGSLGPSGSKEFNMQGDEDKQAKDQANKLGTKAVQGVNLINTHLQGNDKEYENVVRQSRSDAVNWQTIKNDYSKKGILIPIGHEQETINREKQKAYNLPVSQNDIEDARTSVGSSHGFARQFVNKIAKDNTELKSALYHVDAAKSLVNDPNAKERLPKILRNGKMIENGDVDYDAETGQLTRQQGFWGSLLSSFDESEQLKKNYEDYKSIINPDALISKLRSDEKDRQDEPQNEAKGFLGGLGRIVGGSPFKALAAGAVAGAIPGAEEAAPAAMAAVGAPDFYKLGYSAELPRAFKEFTDQGMNEYDALEKAKQSADQAGNFSAMSATLQNLVGGKFAKETELPALSEFKKSVLDGLRQAAKFTGEKLREGGTIGAIGGTGQIMQNIAAQEMGLNRETFEGVKDQVLTGSLLPLAMTLAIKAPQALKKSTYNNIIHHLSKAPEENLQPIVNELKANGVATDEEIQNAQNTIQKESQLNKLIPDDIDELSTLKIKAKIKERDILKDKLETTDEAFHPDIKERIKGLNEDIIELSKNKKTKTDGNETEKTEANAQAEGVLNEQGAGQNIAGAAPSLKGDITDEKSANTIKPQSDLIQPTDAFRTWDLGDMEGKPEDEAAKKHLEQVAVEWNTKPAGTQGETFGEFVNRVIPQFDKILKEEPNNTTITTHSSVLKAMKVWDEMGRPDVANLTPEQKTEFASKYNAQETHNGDLESFKSSNGEVQVIRHGQTEDNKLNNFRSGNTPLTEKGINQAKEVGQQLKDKTGGEIPKIISSDLPRTIHTSNLITEQLKPNQYAIREQPSAQVGAYSNGDGGTGRPVESQGMGSSQQGEGLTGESPGTGKESEITGKEGQIIPPGTENSPFLEADQPKNITSLRNAVTDEKRSKLGMQPAMQAARKIFQASWDEAMQKIEDGYDPNDLVKELKNKPRPLSDVENAILLKHQIDKETDLRQVNEAINQAKEGGDDGIVKENQLRQARLQDELQDIYDVGRKAGTENARGLSIRQMLANDDYSLEAMVSKKRAANGGEKLSDEQMAAVQKQFEEIKAKQADYEKRIAQLESEVNKLRSQQRNTPRPMTKEKAQNVANKLRGLKINKGDKAMASFAAIPTAIWDGAIEAIATTIEAGGAIADAIQKGIEHLRVNGYELTPGQKNEFENNVYIHSGIEKPFTNLLDPEVIKAKAAYERAKAQFNNDIFLDQQKQKGIVSKGADFFTKWQRAFKLSWPSTLGKLGGAGLARLIQSPVEDIVGKGANKVLRLKKAYGEAGVNVKAQATSFKDAFTKGMQDAADVMSKGKLGKSDIDFAFGDKKIALPPEASTWFGQLHSAIKAPIKRAIFEKSLVKRAANMIKDGVDITDPVVQSTIGLDAYKDANRAIFMQDNLISDAYQRVANYLENNKEHATSGKLAATGMRYLMPFVKVPTNIVGETAQLSGLGLVVGGAKFLHTAFTKGIENLTPQEQDMILRNIKKGSIGVAALMVGYMNPSSFGGFWPPQNKEGLKAGQINFFGETFPSWLLHAPLFNAMQLGATIRNIKDKETGKGGDYPMAKAIFEGGIDLANEIPLFEQPAELGKLVNDKDRPKFLGSMAQNTVDPGILQYIAKIERGYNPWTEETARKAAPEGIGQYIESGLPGLTEKVPDKSATNVKTASHNIKRPTPKHR